MKPVAVGCRSRCLEQDEYQQISPHVPKRTTAGARDAAIQTAQCEYLSRYVLQTRACLCDWSRRSAASLQSSSPLSPLPFIISPEHTGWYFSKHCAYTQFYTIIINIYLSPCYLPSLWLSLWVYIYMCRTSIPCCYRWPVVGEIIDFEAEMLCCFLTTNSLTLIKAFTEEPLMKIIRASL